MIQVMSLEQNNVILILKKFKKSNYILTWLIMSNLVNLKFIYFLKLNLDKGLGLTMEKCFL
jgi:hypothetical protein